jgi:NAD(P)-dependent dehydrogenase (short-subunit alcohol dehydrogenase family)
MGQTGSILAYLFFTFFPDQLFSKLPAIDTDLTGRMFLVTGSNTGLGLAAAIHLARLKASRIVLAVRDLNKGAKAKEEIIAQTNFAGIIDVWELDMSKFNSVKGFVERTNRELKRLDGAIINAGIPNPLRRETTEDGWEKLYAFISPIGPSLALMFYFSLQVNAIATGLLSVLLLPLLQATAKLSQEAPHLTLTGSAGTS